VAFLFLPLICDAKPTFPKIHARLMGARCRDGWVVLVNQVASTRPAGPEAEAVRNAELDLEEAHVSGKRDMSWRAVVPAWSPRGCPDEAPGEWMKIVGVACAGGDASDAADVARDHMLWFPLCES
jgi:hypothetical protein